MSAIFGFNEAAAVCAWAVFTFWQVSSYGSNKSRKWYDNNKPDWAPPGYVFPIIWFLLYTACTIAIFYFTQNVQPDSWNIILGVIMYIVHMLGE